MINGTVGEFQDFSQKSLIVHDDFTDVIGIRGVVIRAIDDSSATLLENR